MITTVLDTNIILRYLLQDIQSQFEQAKEVIEEIEGGKRSGLLSILVMNELIWILEKYYELKRPIFIPKIEKILMIEQMKIIEVKKEVIMQVLQKMRKNRFNFTDMYLAANYSQAEIFSFDKDFGKIYKKN